MESVVPARHQDALYGEGRERRLIDQSSPNRRFAARLERDRARGEHALAGIEESAFDDRVRVDHHHGVPLERPSVAKCRLTSRRAAGWFTGLTSQHGRAEPEGDLARPVRAAIVDDEELIPRTHRRGDGLERACEHELLVVRWYDHEKADRRYTVGKSFAVTERPDTEHAEMRRGDHARSGQRDVAATPTTSPTEPASKITGSVSANTVATERVPRG